MKTYLMLITLFDGTDHNLEVIAENQDEAILKGMEHYGNQWHSSRCLGTVKQQGKNGLWINSNYKKDNAVYICKDDAITGLTFRYN